MQDGALLTPKMCIFQASLAAITKKERSSFMMLLILLPRSELASLGAGTRGEAMRNTCEPQRIQPIPTTKVVARSVVHATIAFVPFCLWFLDYIQSTGVTSELHKYRSTDSQKLFPASFFF